LENGLLKLAWEIGVTEILTTIVIRLYIKV
jgi:hypothetical protein